MPLAGLTSWASGCIGSVWPSGLGKIMSLTLTLAFISENPTWILLLQGLLRRPNQASDSRRPANAPIGIVLPAGRVQLVGVKVTASPKFESVTTASRTLQSSFQPAQSFVLISDVAPGPASPSHWAALSRFSKHITPPGSNGGGLAAAEPLDTSRKSAARITAAGPLRSRALIGRLPLSDNEP